MRWLLLLCEGSLQSDESRDEREGKDVDNDDAQSLEEALLLAFGRHLGRYLIENPQDEYVWTLGSRSRPLFF